MKILGKLLQFIKSRGKAERAAIEDLAKVRALPVEIVRQRALELIADPQRSECVKGSLSKNPAIEKLGPLLRDFFLEFESVKEIGGEFSVSRGAVGDSSLRPGFLKVGTDFADSEIVARPGEDQGFIVTDAEHVLDGLPTIYHNIYLLE